MKKSLFCEKVTFLWKSDFLGDFLKKVTFSQKHHFFTKKSLLCDFSVSEPQNTSYSIGSSVVAARGGGSDKMFGIAKKHKTNIL